MLTSYRMSVSGLAAIGLHLWDLTLVVLLLLLMVACGRAILRRLDRTGALEAETWVFALLVGSGVVATAMLALGIVGWLTRPAIGAALILAAAASRTGWRDILRRVRAEDRSAAFVPPGLFGVTAVIGGFMVVESLAPPWDWDTLMYHLDVPRDYLEAGRVFLPADNLHALYVNVVQFLYIPLMAFGGHAAPALLSTAFALLLAVLMGRYGHRVFGAETGAAASALIWSSTIVVLVAVTARVDVTVALFTFAAHCALWSAWRQESAGHLKLCVVLAGLAIGAKANAIPYVIGLGVVGATVLVARHRRTRFGSFGPALAAVAALGLAAVLPWYLKNAMLAGSWTDVLTTGDHLSPWLVELTGYERAASVPGLGQLAVHTQTREPFSIAAFFGAPGSITIEGEASFYFAGAVLALAPLGLLVRGARASAAFFFIPALIFLSLVLARSPVLNTRYLIPIIPPLTIVGSAALARALGVAAASRTKGVLAALVGLLLLPTTFVAGVTTLGHEAYRHALGLESGWESLARRRDVAVPRFVLDSLASDDLVLLVGDAKGYVYTASTLQDNALMNWPVLLATGHADDCLGRTGISHVIIAFGSVDYLRGRGADLEPYGWSAIQGFVRRCLVPLVRTETETLYRVGSDRGGFGRPFSLH